MAVKEWLKENCLSQEWLGRQLGISQQGVSWCLKHGFQARHFSKIVSLSNNRVSLEELADHADQRAVANE